ncbi:MAG: T9SS type A sorting domain-containing protein [Bacteroidetes bacterium]|nr:T9SS type A sorting domain-containing protein [Bacteroidota bacterium]
MGTLNDEIVRGGIEINENLYCFIINTGAYIDTSASYPEIFEYESYIIMTDNDLNVLDSISLNLFEDYYISARTIKKINDTIIVVGRTVKNDYSDEQVFYAAYNVNLDLINCELFGSDTIFEWYSDIAVNHLNEVILYCRNGITNEDGGHVFIKTNVEGSPYEIIYDDYYEYENGVYKIMYNQYHGGYFVITSSSFIKYDLSFHRDTLIYPQYVNRFFNSGYEKQVNNSNFIIGGVKLNFNSIQDPYDVGLYILNPEFQILDSAQIFSTDTLDIFGGLDFNSLDAVFYGGTHNAHYPTVSPFQDEDRWLILQKKNFEDQNIEWNYMYGGDGCYRMTNLFATSDGGSVLMSSYYDWRSTDIPNRDIIIIKVDQGGTIVLKDELSENKKQISVYPNPGANNISIHIFEDILHLELLNSEGKVMISKKLHKGLNIINTEDLPGGIYFYRLKNVNDKMIYRGKWIKK